MSLDIDSLNGEDLVVLRLETGRSHLVGAQSASKSGIRLVQDHSRINVFCTTSSASKTLKKAKDICENITRTVGKSSAGTSLGLALDRRPPALGLAGAGRQGGHLLAVEVDGLVVLARVVVEDVCRTKSKSANTYPFLA